jgi:subtilisin
MPKKKPYPRRFIVIPKPIATRNQPYQRDAWPKRASSKVHAGAIGIPPSQVIDTSPPDGALLVAAPRCTLTQLQAKAGEAKVVEEHWYPLQRFSLRPSAFAPISHRAGTALQKWTVRAWLDDDTRSPLKDAIVTVIPDAASDTGYEGTTDHFGRVQVQVAARLTRVDWLLVAPLHSGWPVAIPNVPIAAGEFEVLVPPIDPDVGDARGLIYGEAPEDAGRGVKVAVLDTGVGAHRAIKLAGGKNTTAGEASARRSDWDGHGSHVAGVIAAAASGWRRGEAVSADLYAYRIFEEGAEEASSFAISTAIKEAAVAGCDLINLSIGGGPFDEAIRDAIDKAWELGCVCLCAAGNDGAGQVDYPARYPKAVAVSAIGLEGSWPAGASQVHQVSRHVGRKLAGMPTFLASFSNRGKKVGLTAPGVGIISTIFGNRWGVMDGTSMATPIATGVLARRLAASPVLTMARNAERAQAIVDLAKSRAQDLGLPARMQGAGLARQSRHDAPRLLLKRLAGRQERPGGSGAGQQAGRDGAQGERRRRHHARRGGVSRDAQGGRRVAGLAP